jgi:predicted nucleotidyltransferase
MTSGIPQKSLNMIIETIDKSPEIDKAAIFGSRAMGNYKNGSDVDIAIFGNKIKPEIINRLSVLLNEELPLPYYFDIVHYESLKDEKLKKHIDIHGKYIYIRQYS